MAKPGGVLIVVNNSKAKVSGSNTLGEGTISVEGLTVSFRRNGAKGTQVSVPNKNGNYRVQLGGSTGLKVSAE